MGPSGPGKSRPLADIVPLSPRLPSPPMGSISSPEVGTIRPNYGTLRARKSRPLADIVTLSTRLPSPPMGSISSPEVVTIRPNYGTLRARKSRPLADIVSDVTSVSFSPDGQYILTGSSDHTAKLWDLKGQELQAFSGHSDLCHLCFLLPRWAVYPHRK